MAIGENLTKREQTLVGVVAFAILLFAAYWWFFYRSKNATLDALEQRIVALETANSRARADVAQGSLAQLRAAADADARTLEMMQTLVPASNEVPGLLEDISTAARRVGLDLASVEPLPVIPGEEFDTYRYKISVIGHYHAIGQLLSNVGSLPRIVAPVHLEIKPPTTPNAPSAQAQRGRPRADPDRPRITALFQVQTYVSRVGPGGRAAAGRSNPPGA